MVIKKDKLRIAILIIACHATLILMLVIFFITDSLLLEEFTPLITLLTPITAMYSGYTSKYLSNSIKAKDVVEREEEIPHARLVRRLIFWHFLAMIFFIFSKVVFNWIEFATLTILMTVTETLFGGFMGSILNAVFTEENT